MGLLGFLEPESADAHDQVTNLPYKGKLSYEALAAAASYEAAKAYEEHVSANGKPDSHAKAKEIVAAASGAFIDHIVETKGLDYLDVRKAKYTARKNAESALVDSGEY